MRAIEARNITMRFGGVTAVNDLSFHVNEGEIVSLIGPNGAGKTTAFNVISGIYESNEGEVLFFGNSPRELLSLKKVLSFCIWGVVFGIAALLAVSIEELWEGAITTKYLYKEPFTWSGIPSSIASTLLALPTLFWIIPLIAGSLLGSLGSFVVWNSQRNNPARAASQGIARTFQNIRLFSKASVVDNVLVGMDPKSYGNIWGDLFRFSKTSKTERENSIRAAELLHFVGLTEYSHYLAGSLSYGHQRRLEIARAMASNPKLLLLDEPAAGLNPSETASLRTLVRAIRDRGITVLLIEHDMKVVMSLSDRIVVLNYGNKIAEGPPDVIKHNLAVIEAYLGTGGGARG